MLEDAIREDAPRAEPPEQQGGWIVAGVLTGLEGAVLTTLCGEAGLAGTLEMSGVLATAANDEHIAKDT